MKKEITGHVITIANYDGIETHFMFSTNNNVTGCTYNAFEAELFLDKAKAEREAESLREVFDDYVIDIMEFTRRGGYVVSWNSPIGEGYWMGTLENGNGQVLSGPKQLAEVFCDEWKATLKARSLNRIDGQSGWKVEDLG